MSIESSPKEQQNQSFIVRIWREPREIKGAPPRWRGMLEHVTSGQRHYFKELGGLVNALTPYLEQMGIKLSENDDATDQISGS